MEKPISRSRFTTKSRLSCAEPVSGVAHSESWTNPKVTLQVHHLVLHQRRLQHGDGGLLKGVAGPAVEVAPARADAASPSAAPRAPGRLGHVRVDVLLGAQDPCDAPAGQPEALGQTVNDQDVVLVHVVDVGGGRDGGAVAVARVVVARVELVADKGGAAAAQILDLGQLGVGHHTARRVAGVRRQDDRGAACDLLGNLIGVDMIAVLLGQGHGDGGKLRAPASAAASQTPQPGALTFLKRLSISL